MEWVLAAIGLLGGFALSAMWWWLLAHKFVPRLSFGDGIAETDDAGSGCVRYRLKVQNTGRRDIIDAQSCEARHIQRCAGDQACTREARGSDA